jgi:hypothetical protein
MWGRDFDAIRRSRPAARYSCSVCASARSSPRVSERRFQDRVKLRTRGDDDRNPNHLRASLERMAYADTDRALAIMARTFVRTMIALRGHDIGAEMPVIHRVK